MADQKALKKLAVHGGPRAVDRLEGRGRPKFATEEFMSLAERFGLSDAALAKIHTALEEESLSPNLFLGHFYANIEETKTEAFERKACEVFGAKYALGVSSGTGALHSALVAAGCRPGTEVICSAIGFYATAAAIVQAKSVPVFCDVDASLHMDPVKLEALITPRTVAIAPTHVMGEVADMRAIMRVARKHKLKVVEDCAQSCGAAFKNKKVGTFGDLGCFSISSYKMVGAGEGGLILAKTRRLWERAYQFAESGGLWRPDRFAPPRYEGEVFVGTNYRMSELEAAVDVVQLGRVEQLVKQSRTAKLRVLKRLAPHREIVPQQLNDIDGMVGYRLRFFPESVELAEQITEALLAEGVSAVTRGRNAEPDWHIYSHMYPILMQASAYGKDCIYDCPYYVEQGGHAEYARGDCPVADDLFDRMVDVDMNPWWTARDCQRVAKGINKVLDAYCTRDPKAAPWL